MSKPVVYFSRTITPDKVVALYEQLNKTLPGKVAVKVHSGEAGNQNFLRPAFWKPMVDRVQGVVTECNTAYEGSRDTAEHHWQTLRDHGWCDAFPVDLMDEEAPDLELPIPQGEADSAQLCGQPSVPLRQPAGAVPLQRAPHGRLRRSAQAAVHRRGLLSWQGLYPWRGQREENLVLQP